MNLAIFDVRVRNDHTGQELQITLASSHAEEARLAALRFMFKGFDWHKTTAWPAQERMVARLVEA